MFNRMIVALVAALASWSAAPAQLPTSEFLYQGQLKDASGPVTTAVDLKFRLYGASSGGSPIASELSVNSLTPDAEGRFSIELDFGASAFAVTDERWLEIDVRPAGGGSYTTLAPRQRLSASPRALVAGRAPWSGLVGIPAGFADGSDDGVTAAGTGLSLSGSTLSLDLNYADNRYHTIGTVQLNGDASGFAGAVTVGRLQGRNVVGSQPAHNDVLTWDINQGGWAPKPTQHWTPGQGMQQITGSYAVDYAVLDTRYLNQNIIIDGDATGLFSANTVVALQGRPVSPNPPAVAQVLKWNGTQWAPSADANTTYTAGTGLLLSSNQFSMNTVTLSTLYVDESQTSSGDVSGTYSALTVVGLRGRAVASTAPAVGETLKWNGTQWTPAADANTVTSVNPPLNLLSGALGLTTDTISAVYLANDLGSLSKVSNGVLTTNGSQVNSTVPVFVTGNVQSSAAVRGASFTFTSAVTRTWSGAALEWRVGVSSGATNVSFTSNGWVGSSGFTTYVMEQDIHLPHGAGVSGLTFYALDNVSNDITVQLIAMPHNGTAHAVVGTASSSGAVAGTVRTFTNSASHTVDNTTSGYRLRATWTTDGIQPANTRLHGVTVTYTVSTPLP